MRRCGLAILWFSFIPCVLICHYPGAAEFWCAAALPLLRTRIAALTSEAAGPVCSMIFLAFIPLAVFFCLPKGRRFLSYFSALLILCFSATWLAPCALSENMPSPETAQLQKLCEKLSVQAAQYIPLHHDFDPQQVLIEASRLTDAGITPKACIFPSVAKSLGLAGWWSPLTSEAVVDATMSELNLPFVACHELMHAKGIASEAHANYLAYLACMQGDETFRYSGTMNALWYAMRCLHKTDETAWQEVVSQMNAAVWVDFRRMNGFDEAATSALSGLQDALTQLYLSLTGADDYDAFAAWLVFSGKFA